MDYNYNYEEGRRSSEVGTDLERSAGFADQNNAYSFNYNWDEDFRSYTLQRDNFYYEGELSEEGNIVSRVQYYEITDQVGNRK